MSHGSTLRTGMRQWAAVEPWGKTPSATAVPTAVRGLPPKPGWAGELRAASGDEGFTFTGARERAVANRVGSDPHSRPGRLLGGRRRTDLAEA